MTSFSLHALTLFHHAHHSTVTALFYRPPKVDEELVRKKTAGMTVERDLLGLTEQSRIVLFSSQADLEESLELQRSMLQEYVHSSSGDICEFKFLFNRYPHVKVSSQLIDAHLYLVKRWVIDYLGDKKYVIIGYLLLHPPGNFGQFHGYCTCLVHNKYFIHWILIISLVCLALYFTLVQTQARLPQCNNPFCHGLGRTTAK